MSEYLEVRNCQRDPFSNGDILVEIKELYIRTAM